MSTAKKIVFYTSETKRILDCHLNIVAFSLNLNTALVEPFQLLLTIQPLDPGQLYQTQFPVAWHIADFDAAILRRDTVTYTDRLGLGVNQITSTLIVTLSDISINLGERATYTEAGWQSPVADPPPGGRIFAVNGSPQLLNISFGLYDDADRYKPLIFEKDVTFTEAVGGVFQPILFAYEAADVQEGQYFTAKIENQLGFWDVRDFAELTYFLIYNDPLTTQLKIIETPSIIP